MMAQITIFQRITLKFTEFTAQKSHEMYKNIVGCSGIWRTVCVAMEIKELYYMSDARMHVVTIGSYTERLSVD